MGGTGGDDHSSIAIASVHSLIKHDILRVVLFCIGAIGVSKALLALHDARHGGEVLSAPTSVV